MLKVIGSPQPSLASAGCVIVRGNKLLAVNLSYKQGLALPGGMLDAGESFEQAAIREVKEETGYEIKINKLIGEYACFDDFPTINKTFVAEIVGGNLSESKEGKVRWVQPKKFLKQAAYQDARLAVTDYFG